MPYSSFRSPTIARVLMPRAYMNTILSSKPGTVIAALRCDRINAPFVFDQPINGASFTAWVEEQLCPTLARGDIVITATCYRELP